MNDKIYKRYDNAVLRLLQFGRMQILFVIMYCGIFETGADQIWGIVISFVILLVCEGSVVYIEYITFKKCNKSPTGKHQYTTHQYAQSGFLTDDEPQKVLACKYCKTVKRNINHWSE